MGLGGKTCSTQLPKGIAGGDVGAGQRSNPIQQCFCPAPYFDFIRRRPLYLDLVMELLRSSLTSIRTHLRKVFYMTLSSI